MIAPALIAALIVSTAASAQLEVDQEDQDKPTVTQIVLADEPPKADIVIVHWTVIDGSPDQNVRGLFLSEKYAVKAAEQAILCKAITEAATEEQMKLSVPWYIWVVTSLAVGGIGGYAAYAYSH